ncbi:MAG: OmpA family protein [Cyclobacteriaceae bacterium]
MNRLLLFVSGLLISSVMYAQNVQWGNKITDYSSQANNSTLSAEQALGQPDALFNDAEDDLKAWRPKEKLALEYLEVGFDEPMQIQQVAVAESAHPTALTQLYAIDEDGDEHFILDFEPRELPLQARLFRIYFDLTPYKVKAVRLIFNNQAFSAPYAIDAVAISDSKIPISFSFNQERIQDYFVAERLNEEINSDYNELKPLISPDNQTLYFSRQNHPENYGGKKDPEDIWFSERDNLGNWKKAENIGPPLNNKGPNFISSITPDGNSILLLLGNKYIKRNKMTAGLSISTKTEDGWTYPEPVIIKNDYNLSNKANFFLANNQKVIIMAIQRDDSRGNRDLYVSFKQDDGTWSEPKNMGKDINSSAEEAAPFLSADGKTLFFSSRGFNGFGGYDIFISKRLDDTWRNWSYPENLGSSINSAYDDIFFNISIEDDFAYFSRSSDKDVDVFRVKVPYYQQPDFIVKVKGKVVNAWTNVPIGTTIQYFGEESQKEVAEASSNAVTGDYQLILPAGEMYKFYANYPGYIPYQDTLNLRNISSNTTIERDLLMVPIKTEEPITLNNVFFKFATADLREESYPELDRLLSVLKKNPELKIEISGHTCSIGNDDFNQKLSEKRAYEIYYYLATNGINSKRLSAVGYGENMPKASNETEEGRMINRRVEFRITTDSIITSSEP